MSTTHLTYHVMFDDETADVLALFRISTTPPTTGEAYQPGKGWVPHAGVFDILLNGQDYDLIDAEEANQLADEMERGLR